MVGGYPFFNSSSFYNFPGRKLLTISHPLMASLKSSAIKEASLHFNVSFFGVLINQPDEENKTFFWGGAAD